MPRVQRRFLHGSRWTALVDLTDSEGERHFEVVGVSAAATGERVELRAILTERRYWLPVRALEDEAAWATGWQSLPPAEG
jgi:tryptophan-rich hypothetical protein